MAKRQYNKWRELADGTIEIELTQGKVALIDKVDKKRVLRYKWCAHFERGRWYAISSVTIGPYTAKPLRMHRIVMNAPDGMDVDHVDHDCLNNGRSNLRIATRGQNLANGAGYPDRRSSKYKGVYLDPRVTLNRRWVARFQDKRLGYFTTEAEAGQAYNAAVLEAYGEFAYQNDVEVA